MSFSIVTGLNPRACHEATNASTHSAWNSQGSAVTGSSRTAPPSITRNWDVSGTPSSLLNGQGSTLKT